jgi:quercetin dioxygenase-like cupin family protein
MSAAVHPSPQNLHAQVVLRCLNLEDTIAFYTEQLDFRLDMIMPADAPKVAVIFGHGIQLRLQKSTSSPTEHPPLHLRLTADTDLLRRHHTKTLIGPNAERIELVDPVGKSIIPASIQEFHISRASAADAWAVGRASMHYRDLLPSRFGGAYIASHIRIPLGGPVPDYVHYHRVGFQMIFCARGWVKVVYEDQGPPFVMQAGDLVLQPPTIRHRVLEASDGLEVIEIGCPAEHETFREHLLQLPTAVHRPQRLFGGQRFCLHSGATAPWTSIAQSPFEAQTSAIKGATNGLAQVRILRTPAAELSASDHVEKHRGDFLFMAVLEGDTALKVEALGDHQLAAGDTCVIPHGATFSLTPRPATRILQVNLAPRS